MSRCTLPARAARAAARELTSAARSRARRAARRVGAHASVGAARRARRGSARRRGRRARPHAGRARSTPSTSSMVKNHCRPSSISSPSVHQVADACRSCSARNSFLKRRSASARERAQRLERDARRARGRTPRRPRPCRLRRGAQHLEARRCPRTRRQAASRSERYTREGGCQPGSAADHGTIAKMSLDGRGSAICGRLRAARRLLKECAMRLRLGSCFGSSCSLVIARPRRRRRPICPIRAPTRSSAARSTGRQEVRWGVRGEVGVGRAGASLGEISC